MASAVSDNALFLYKCLVESKHKMDWNLIGGALGLKSGTASMRWQRLKPRLDKMDFDSVPASNVIDEHTMFLYQCIIYGDVKINWDAVGKATHLKSGTASMRYRRLVDKIKAQGVSNVTMAAPPTVQKAKVPARAKAPRKRKAKAPEKDSDTEDDDLEIDMKKKVKLEDAGTPSKRATCGKNIKYEESDASDDESSHIASSNVSSEYQENKSDVTASSYTNEEIKNAKGKLVADVMPKVSDGTKAKVNGVLEKAPARIKKEVADKTIKRQESTNGDADRGDNGVLQDAPKVDTDESMYATPRGSPAPPSEVQDTKGPADYNDEDAGENSDDDRSDLAKLTHGQKLLKHNSNPKSTAGTRTESEAPTEIKSEAATVNGPTYTRPADRRGSVSTNMLQDVNDRGSVTPEDSISSVGAKQGAITPSEADILPEQKKKGYFGRWFEQWKSP